MTENKDLIIYNKIQNISSVKDIKSLLSEYPNENDLFIKILREVSCKGNIKLLQFLKINGVDLRSENDYALLMSVKYQHLNSVKYLVELGSNIHVSKEANFIKAVRNKDYAVISYLLEESKDSSIKTSLLSAVEQGDFKMFEILLHYNHKINKQYQHNSILLKTIEKQKDYPQIISVLVLNLNIDFSQLDSKHKDLKNMINKFLNIKSLNNTLHVELDKKNDMIKINKHKI